MSVFYQSWVLCAALAEFCWVDHLWNTQMLAVFKGFSEIILSKKKGFFIWEETQVRTPGHDTRPFSSASHGTLSPFLYKWNHKAIFTNTLQPTWLKRLLPSTLNTQPATSLLRPQHTHSHKKHNSTSSPHVLLLKYEFPCWLQFVGYISLPIRCTQSELNT